LVCQGSVPQLVGIYDQSYDHGAIAGFLELVEMEIEACFCSMFVVDNTCNRRLSTRCIERRRKVGGKHVWN